MSGSISAIADYCCQHCNQRRNLFLLDCCHSLCEECVSDRCVICGTDGDYKSDELLNLLQDLPYTHNCSNCFTEATNWFCKTCDASMCDPCYRSIHLAPMFSKHDVSEAKLSQIYCRHHRPAVLCFANKPLCIECWEQLDNSERAQCVKTEKAALRAKNAICDVKKRISCALEESNSSISHCDRIGRELNESVENKRLALNELYKQLLSELESIYCKLDKELVNANVSCQLRLSKNKMHAEAVLSRLQFHHRLISSLTNSLGAADILRLIDLILSRSNRLLDICKIDRTLEMNLPDPVVQLNNNWALHLKSMGFEKASFSDEMAVTERLNSLSINHSKAACKPCNSSKIGCSPEDVDFIKLFSTAEKTLQKQITTLERLQTDLTKRGQYKLKVNIIQSLHFVCSQLPLEKLNDISSGNKAQMQMLTSLAIRKDRVNDIAQRIKPFLICTTKCQERSHEAFHSSEIDDTKLLEQIKNTQTDSQIRVDAYQCFERERHQKVEADEAQSKVLLTNQLINAKTKLRKTPIPEEKDVGRVVESQSFI